MKLNESFDESLLIYEKRVSKRPVIHLLTPPPPTRKALKKTPQKITTSSNSKKRYSPLFASIPRRFFDHYTESYIRILNLFYYNKFTSAFIDTAIINVWKFEMKYLNSKFIFKEFHRMRLPNLDRSQRKLKL